MQDWGMIRTQLQRLLRCPAGTVSTALAPIGDDEAGRQAGRLIGWLVVAAQERNAACCHESDPVSCQRSWGRRTAVRGVLLPEREIAFLQTHREMTRALCSSQSSKFANA